jgi:hypothetical protein
MATSSGNVGGGGYNKPVSTVIKRDISIKDKSQASSCPCKNLPGKVTCGICNPKRK